METLLLPAVITSMKNILLLLVISPMICFADPVLIGKVSSPVNRVALMELYTSEGCSSCPPADRFLSRLKQSGLSKDVLIPLAFHVTYWDYIGWKDPYGTDLYDKRQREMAAKNSQGTIYTPQFVLSGKDFRRYQYFTDDVTKLSTQHSTVDLVMNVYRADSRTLTVTLKTDISRSKLSKVQFYLAVSENNLSSQVTDGENEGELLHHDYVVRKLIGPYKQVSSDTNGTFSVDVKIDSDWKTGDLSLVGFAQNPQTGEILQAVKLEKL